MYYTLFFYFILLTDGCDTTLIKVLEIKHKINLREMAIGIQIIN